VALLAESRASEVMISYRGSETGRDGDSTVTALTAALQSRGYSVFQTMGLMGGEAWPDAIQAGVRDSRAVVALCSPGYGGTTWTKRELMLADALGKTLIPVWHSGAYPPAEAGIYLTGLQYVPQFAGGAQGFVAAGYTVERVADELCEALMAAGIEPSGELG